jgi:hypothetical protein
VILFGGISSKSFNDTWILDPGNIIISISKGYLDEDDF